MMNLPGIYLDFYQRCQKLLPPALVGTDLAGEQMELTETARDLLGEVGLPDMLRSDDFVFMMHQGYIFWFFQVNGVPDPDVFGFMEGDRDKRYFGKFSTFIAGFKP
jgi:hypothetical protein